MTIDDFLDALGKGQAGMDVSTFWPAHSAQIEASFSDLIAMRVFSKYREDKGKFLEGLRRVSVDCIRCHLFSSGIIGLKVARIFGHENISVEEMEEYILTILNHIQDRVFNDALCRDGKNLLFSEEEIEKWLAKGIIFTLTDEDKKVVSFLNVALESLSWAIFYDMYRYGGFAISGPYKTTRGTVLIRDGFDLAPPFWPFKSKYGCLREVLVYENGVQIEGDFMNHFVYKEPIVFKLKAFRIESNSGIFDSIGSLIKLTAYLERLRRKHTEYVNSLDPLQIITKGAEIYSYLWKGFWDYYGEEWKPDAEIQKRILKYGLKYWRRYGLSKEKKDPSYYRNLYDPRSNFVE